MSPKTRRGLQQQQLTKVFLPYIICGPNALESDGHVALVIDILHCPHLAWLQFSGRIVVRLEFGLDDDSASFCPGGRDGLALLDLDAANKFLAIHLPLALLQLASKAVLAFGDLALGDLKLAAIIHD